MKEFTTDEMVNMITKAAQRAASRGMHVPIVYSPYFKINGIGFLIPDYGIDNKGSMYPKCQLVSPKEIDRQDLINALVGQSYNQHKIKTIETYAKPKYKAGDKFALYLH